MSQPKWTPGPWKADNKTILWHEPNEAGEMLYTVIRANPKDDWDGSVKAFCPCETEKDNANAHLIAAAPEMVEALEACLASIDHAGIMPGSINDKLVQQIKSALRKARGEE